MCSRGNYDGCTFSGGFVRCWDFSSRALSRALARHFGAKTHPKGSIQPSSSVAIDATQQPQHPAQRQMTLTTMSVRHQKKKVPNLVTLRNLFDAMELRHTLLDRLPLRGWEGQQSEDQDFDTFRSVCEYLKLDTRGIPKRYLMMAPPALGLDCYVMDHIESDLDTKLLCRISALVTNFVVVTSQSQTNDAQEELRTLDQAIESMEQVYQEDLRWLENEMRGEEEIL